MSQTKNAFLDKFMRSIASDNDQAFEILHRLVEAGPKVDSKAEPSQPLYVLHALEIFGNRVVILYNICQQNDAVVIGLLRSVAEGHIHADSLLTAIDTGGGGIHIDAIITALVINRPWFNAAYKGWLEPRPPMRRLK